MISVSKTIIYKNAMMIKFLNTSITKVTMLSVFGSKGFAGNTNIIKMIVFSNQSL